MIEDISLVYDELKCYRCGSVQDIEDSICQNCGARLVEDTIFR